MITTRAREAGTKEHRAKQKWPRETHSVTYVLGLSNLSNLSRIDVQPPPSFLCCPRPPSHHPSILTSVSLVPALHLLMPNRLLVKRYSSILSTCINRLNTIWSALLSNSLSNSISPTHLVIPNSIHSWHFNQTAQTLHLKNIHFPSLSTSHTPCLCSLQRRSHNCSFISPLLGLYPQSSIAQHTFQR